MVITTGILGYTEETTYAVRKNPADGQLRRFGIETSPWKMPKEKVTPNVQMVASSFDPQTLTYGDRLVEFKHEYYLVDAKELSYIGQVTTTDTTTPDKRHRITPTEPSQAFVNDSRTIHCETAGVVTKVDIAGCLTTNLELSSVKGDPRGVLIKEDFIGQRIVDDNVTTNLLGHSGSETTQDPEGVQGVNVANDLDNASPGSHPITFSTADFRTANGYETAPKAFIWPTTGAVNIGGTITMTDGDSLGNLSGGTDLTSSCSKWTIKIGHEYEFYRPNRTGTNNYGKSIQPYIFGARLKSRTITSVFELDPDSTVMGLFVDGMKETSTNELYIKVQKSNDSNDWIVFAFKPTSGTTSNIYVDWDGSVTYKAITNKHLVGFQNKNINIIAGNEFDTLRSLSGT